MKHKSRKEESERTEDDSKKSYRTRDRDRERDKDRKGERHRDREKRDRDIRRSEKERSSDSEDKHDKEKEKRRDGDKDRNRSLDDERERARERKRERDKEDRERERERERDKERRERAKEKERERDREKEKREQREREDRERERMREREREREREKERRIRERERRREVDSDYSDDKDSRDRESPRTNSADDDSDNKEKKPTREEEMEDEHRRLDEEMEKRRRRVQEWQELRRKKEEAEREKHGDMLAMESLSPDLQNGVDYATGDEEIDPLDAFMNSMVLPEVKKLNSDTAPSTTHDKSTDVKTKRVNGSNGDKLRKGSTKSIGRIIPGEDSDSDYADLENDGDSLEDEDDDEKNFYIEVKEISKMNAEEVAAYRKQLELKIHGKDVPKPVKSWNQTGLTSKILETIKKLNYEKPMSIQAQALPVIMSGRDCIGIAKTGSGKTLAFVLPMLRHIKDQPPLVAGDGPIGLIMAPTRELVQQIHSDIKKFTKVLGLQCVPVYGGSGVAQQISELKRGTEIVVCTPGRMIDILCTSGGKITNLRRVTYLVMDEADRMFDMGFEPQITRIVQNIRPDRQTVLFSATFPRQVETLARKVLTKPVEIQVGGRSVVNKDIAQLVEEKCDALFKDLLRHGYACLSLHGAKDQTDRESTISDFKNNVCNLLIATSIAARGLDVKELELVINFDAPNHYEDYVHRVGRTGRAGRKGCAITFVSEEDTRYAPDLVKALELSEQVVPDDLKALADGFMAKVNQGLEQAHGTGYGGSGFKFNEEEDEVRRAAKKAQAKEYGFEEDKSDSEDEDSGIRKANGDISQHTTIAQLAAIAAASKVAPVSLPTSISTAQMNPSGGAASVVGGTGLPIAPNDGAALAALQAAINLQHNLAKIQADAMPEHYEAELEINDFPQNARWKVTHKETLVPISEWTGAAITTRGQHFPPGKVPGPGDRKLYLFIEGPTEQSVKRAKAELKRVLEDITNQALQLPGGAQPGKYSVI
ncbi:putative Dead box ATP-dependent RNA helicase [Quillaja saponaria]|uniref:RNA helicase n=1 Tax=Quillaja saponaria TaxID=32244 RepID=A0AAD7VIN4_QUISA|nr:putative Dead box ATP-dependent RNA helicase [Quillaja saponaria]